jgi:benzoyl-CoA reductase/2-hydroxyglutaryl-CoA dehydratase subunit BcrC/BadD/HgdB
LLGIHSPRCIGTLTQDQVDGVMAQIKAMVPTLEKVAGKRLDIDQLKQVIDSSYRCSLGWKQVLESAKHLPSPLTFFDGTIHMAPAVVLRGDERAVRYYDLLEKELKARIDEGVGAVDDERFRLYWEGMPVWGKLRENAQLLGSKHACVVASTYCHSWIFEDLAHPDPFEGMARAYTALFIVRDEAYKEAYLTRMVQDYGVRGLIFHDAKTCPNNSNNRYGLPRRLREKIGIPHIVIHGDLNDLRLYSEEQTNTQFEAFIEQLE